MDVRLSAAGASLGAAGSGDTADAWAERCLVQEAADGIAAERRVTLPAVRPLTSTATCTTSGCACRRTQRVKPWDIGASDPFRFPSAAGWNILDPQA